MGRKGICPYIYHKKSTKRTRWAPNSYKRSYGAPISRVITSFTHFFSSIYRGFKYTSPMDGMGNGMSCQVFVERCSNVVPKEGPRGER